MGLDKSVKKRLVNGRNQPGLPKVIKPGVTA
jgi:hypothetical protein